MRGSLVFLSDVHIVPGDKDKVRHFSEFLDALKHDKASQLYVLGDLFDYWAGPGHEKQPEYGSVLRKIRELVDSGTEVYIFHGNRDFLLDSNVEQITGASISGEQMRLRLGDKTVHLCHGDHLCDDDQTYQSLRRFLRHVLFRVVYGACPFFVRDCLARTLRDISRKTVAKKPREVVGLSAGALERVFGSDVDVLVCGHTHVHRQQTIDCNGGPRLLYNLGDWSTTGSYLVYRAESFELRRYEW
jgi:UDP-2,3-diacylglucosamine hydrolase